MSIRHISFAAAGLVRYHAAGNCLHMSSKSGTGRRVVKSGISKVKKAPAPANADPWVEVLDKSSGGVYFWNQTTNETTHIGAPKPTGLTAPTGQTGIVQQQEQPQSMASSLGQTVAQGFAFGVGSSIAHSVVGSMFGGGSSHSSDDSGGGDSGGDGGTFDL